jgi:hypothetical protein
MRLSHGKIFWATMTGVSVMILVNRRNTDLNRAELSTRSAAVQHSQRAETK